jgi:hypothetical protein
MVRWRDAYTFTKSNLKQVVGELGKTAMCKTHGRVVHKDKTYTVVEQHTASVEYGNDYFIIPTALIIRKKRRK